jgi:hypothetical protein
VRGIWIFVLAGALLASVACSGDAAPADNPDVVAPKGITDALDDLATRSPDSSDQINEFRAFCDLIRSDVTADVPAASEVLSMYRLALAEAPPEIINELAALLDYLEFGIAPDFGDPPPTEELIPNEESTEDPASEPSDPYLFVATDAEQLALSVAAFLDLRCRGVALNPLPPPTVPAALPAE